MQAREQVQTQLATLGYGRGTHLHAGFRALETILDPDERLIAVIPGTYRSLQGVAAVTDRRLIFAGQRFGFLKKREMEQFLFRSISSVDIQHGRLLGKLTVLASGNSGTIDQVPNVALDAFVAALRSRLT